MVLPYFFSRTTTQFQDIIKVIVEIIIVCLTVIELLNRFCMFMIYCSPRVDLVMFLSNQKKTEELAENQEETAPQTKTEETGEFGKLDPETQEYETDGTEEPPAEASEPVVPEEVKEFEAGAAVHVSIFDDKVTEEEADLASEQVSMTVDHTALQGMIRCSRFYPPIMVLFLMLYLL